MALNANTMSLGELLRVKLAQMEDDQMEADPKPAPKLNLYPARMEEDGEIGGYVGTTLYSALGLTAHKFRVLVAHLADHAVNLANNLGASAIAVRGTSGYSVAFAMRMLTSFPIIVARKPTESSHGRAISLVDNGEGNVINSYLILDDLVDSGATVNQMMRDLKPSVCVGILEYYGLMQAVNAGCSGHSQVASRGRKVNGVARYGYDY